MPGTILSVNVSNGSAVKKGDVLMILEAMKMENEIMAPCDGTVTSVSVDQGRRRGVRRAAVHHRLTPEDCTWKLLPISL